ncbi:MAG: SMI1/KNR4 family protein [Lachnospiraceae bacterium]|nr:SMI1/KNR4 family protein [Candidatus Equihabitans merdae]
MWTDISFNEPFEGTMPDMINNVTLPSDYTSFMQTHNGCEGDTGASWLVLYPIEELQEINDDFSEDLPEGHIIIGSNGGGELIGLTADGEYLIVPEIIEEEYLEIIGDNIENLPADINNYWEKMDQ